MAAATTTLPVRPFGVRARRWLRDNLFSSVANTLLTVVSAAVAAYVVYSVGRFVLVDAEWNVITENRRLIFLGRYPAGEEWRIWPPIWLFGLLVGLSLGLWGRIGWREALVLVAALGFTFGFLAHGENGIRLAVAVVLGVAAYPAARRLRETRRGSLARRVAVGGWAALLPLALVLLLVGDGVRPTLWGGFLLNVLLAAVGLEAAIPLGILFALGRASSYRVIKVAATAYIETIRGAPLIAWLFIAWFVMPDFLPPVAGISRMDLVLRAMLMLSLFTAAYIAEIVRGGLQSVPRGQVEAAEALGLSTFSITALIVLPQALRAVIPAMVSQLISLWKDTSLVSIIALIDGLAAAQAVLAQRPFFGRQAEVLFFVALVFWSVAFTMSRLSLRLERALGVGVR